VALSLKVVVWWHNEHLCDWDHDKVKELLMTTRTVEQTLLDEWKVLPPRLHFKSAVGEVAIEDCTHKLLEQQNCVETIAQVSGEFFDPVNVARFPLDKQDFWVKIGFWPSSVPQGENVIVTPPLTHDVMRGKKEVLKKFETKPVLTSKEWRVLPICFKYSPKPGSDAHLSVGLNLARLPHYYIYSILMPGFLIAFLSLCSFVFDPVDGYSDRVSLNTTLLLTITAMKFAYADAMPKVPYLTTLDKIIFTNFGALFWTVVLQGMVARLQRPDLDVYAFAALASANSFIFLWVLWVSRATFG
jgi:hypothetical protein